MSIEPLNPEADGYLTLDVSWLDNDGAPEDDDAQVQALEQMDENDVVTFYWRNATLALRAGTALAIIQNARDKLSED